ncbi:Zn(II)2Cys6 transcription factor [Aspergillus bombycis]|uniref:Zn(II)2Cys6 transcription factor n=1 Tax=Aspergillus bombycis TaxID=109264 RepID=A0A1F7ZYH9_9EURO|nr:Zn(II)2Cys6 transcription factor [Aspergillus bombycis]OGM44511.1 Zn(II)2Cys6 transcription factor [Aspergillus bombycis]
MISVKRRSPSKSMEASHNKENRVKKRSSNACQRCRRQKIKCSGSQPCDTCSKRKSTCTFDDRDQKILVTRGYLEDLQRKLALLKGGEDEAFSPQSMEQEVLRPTTEGKASVSDATGRAIPTDPILGGDDLAVEGEPDWSHNLEGASQLTNPLSSGPSTFMAAASGRIFYLGTSSNWSFARKILSMTHEHLYNSPLPTGSLYFDGSAYDLGWEGTRTTVTHDIPMAPPLDFSIYLINAVKFHAGQLFHLFDEETFMGGLYAFYENPEHEMAHSGLWYIHYLLILAFGKAFVVQRNQGSRPSGCEFFTKALQLLPDTTNLCRDPIVATEILCCIALYLQSLDCRNSAHNYIGQAARIAQAQGMHTNMSAEHLGDAIVQRCRRIWWTIYILDRQMTSLMGLPQSIRDDQLHHELPYFPGSPQKAIALSMQIKVCQIMDEISSSVYGPDGRLNRNFLLRTKSALASAAEVITELRKCYDLRLDESSISGVSRLSAHLHLLYHQCIVLATRPVLFCFLKMRIQTTDSSLESLNSSANVRKLLQVCIDSAQQILNILMVLQRQNLLDSFLPFDLEATYTAAVVLVAAPAADASLLDDWTPWFHTSVTVLDEMISRGNLIAGFRKSELQQLAGMLSQLTADGDLQSVELARKGQLDRIISRLPSPSTPDRVFGISDIPNLHPGLTTAEIMAVAESIDTGDVDWIAHAVTENHIW